MGVCVLGLATDRAAAEDDWFVRQRDREAAQGREGGFSISFAGGRHVFRPGETIELVFSFLTHDEVSPFNYEHCSGLGVADAVLDHTDGTADPQADLWKNAALSQAIFFGFDASCGVLSGVMGGVPAGTPPQPVEFSVYLNQAVRFDRPGSYRFYVRSHHALDDVASGSRPPFVSNILELEIVARDEGWEATTLDAALHVVDSSKEDAERIKAARIVSYLGSARAAREMAQRFEHTTLEADDSDYSHRSLDTHWLRGLYGSRDRSNVVAEMEKQLDRDDRYVPLRYISHLAVLNLARNDNPIGRSRYDSMVRAYSTRHMAVLRAAGTLRAELKRTFELAAGPAVPDLGRIDLYGLPAGYVAFPDDVEGALTALAPEQQRRFLLTKRNWRFFRDPAFVPMLRRLAIAGVPGGPQDVAARLLYDVAADEGREVVWRELSKADSLLGIVGTNVLPEPILPDLELTFVKALERARTPEQYLIAIERVERFGTARIFRQVRTAFERFAGARGCRLAPPALAYFFRVAPRYARAALPEVMAQVYAGEQCESGVLPAVAAHRMMPAVEAAAIRQLDSPNAWAISDAARMLRWHGTARAEKPLWQAMERWHERWKGQSARLEQDQHNRLGVPWEAALEWDLSTALINGNGWLMDQSSVRRVASLCVTESHRDHASHASSLAQANPTINPHPSEMPRGEPEFAATAVTMTILWSRGALQRWAMLHPSGTLFTWYYNPWSHDRELWLAGEEERLFDDTHALLEAHGMKLVRDRP